MILVAGGTGRLGTLLVHRLVARSAAVRVLTRSRARAAHFDNLPVGIIEGDVRVASNVRRAVAGASVVVSAIHGFTGPRGISPASVDRDGNRHLIDGAAQEGAALVLVSVVGAAADSPMELFRMKHAAEQHLRASGTNWTIVRSTAFLETWAAILLQTTDREGRVVVFGTGENPINFVSASDVADVLDRAIADPGTRGQTIEIGGPENLTLSQLAQAIQPAGLPVSPRHVPRAALRTMSLVLRPFWPERARQGAAALAMDTINLRFDPSAIRTRYPDLSLASLSNVVERSGLKSGSSGSSPGSVEP